MYKVPKNINNINEYRYLRFTTGVSGNKAVKLESLLPTADAAEQHFFRVYLQVQRWLSRDLPANVWGWAEKETLVPVTMTVPPAPKERLDMMFCKCKTVCTIKCPCRKAGLLCSSVCSHCYSNTCDNLPAPTVIEDDMDIDREEKDDYEEDSDGTSDEAIDERSEKSSDLE